MKQIYIFRGSPASGKSSLAKEFSKLIPGKVAFLELDTFRWEFHLVNRDITEIAVSEHQLAYTNYLSVLENYLADGRYTVVTEGLFSWNTESPHGNLHDVIALCNKYSRTYQSIVLSASSDTLWHRNSERQYSVPREEFEELYNHVTHEVSDTEFLLDVESNSVSSSIQILSELLK